MVTLWTLLVILLLFLIACFLILRFQANALRTKEEGLRESFWARANRIPILSEVLKRAGVTGMPIKEIIDVREQRSIKPFPLSEQVNLERKLSGIVEDILTKCQDNPVLKIDSLYLALKGEFKDISNDMHLASKDYNFELKKWNSYLRLPWFMIFKFAFKIGEIKPVGNI